MKQTNILFMAEINNKTAALLIQRMNEIVAEEKEKVINLLLSTDGGSVKSTLDICNTIKYLRDYIKINTVNFGGLSSGGCYLFAMGEKRLAMQETYFSFHAQATQIINKTMTPHELKADADDMNGVQEIFDGFLKESCNPFYNRARHILREKTFTFYKSSDKFLKGYVTKMIDEIPGDGIFHSVIWGEG